MGEPSENLDCPPCNDLRVQIKNQIKIVYCVQYTYRNCNVQKRENNINKQDNTDKTNRVDKNNLHIRHYTTQDNAFSFNAVC